MALETLKGVEKIDGFDLVVMDDLRAKYPEKFNESGAMDYKWFEADIRPKSFIYVRHDKNSISFTIQNGPIKEHGVNGCQVDQLISTASIIIQGLDRKFPSVDNKLAIQKLAEATLALQNRKREREARGVEGKSEA